MCELGSKLNYTPIPLDFRGFDIHMPAEFRFEVSKLLLNIFKEKEEINNVVTKLAQLYANQKILGPDAGYGVQLIDAYNQLLSGIANTQADGSTLNECIQHYLAESLGFENDYRLGLTLGDDAVI